MSQLKTKCPSCGAIYPMPAVKVGDPTARAKCGRCQQVFFLNENLVQPPVETPKTQPNPVSNNIAQKNDAFDEVDEFSRFLDEQINQASPKTESSPQFSATRTASSPEDLLKKMEAHAKQGTNAKPVSTDANINLSNVITPAAFDAPKKDTLQKVFAHAPTTQQLATKRSFFGQLMWAIGCVILLGLLIVQYTLFNLDTIIKNPQHAKRVESFCKIAKCVTPSADISNINVQSSYKNYADGTDIVILITNRNQKEQLYPDLLVRLKSADGAVVGDFIASRRDYLAESQKSILGNQQKRIMLTTKTDKKPAFVEVTPIYYQDL